MDKTIEPEQKTKSKIAIKPQNNTSITHETEPFELGNYTIFAGENNAGKSHLMRAIKEEIESQNTIFIPAEKIDANEQVKISAANDPMRSAISKLLDITITSMPNIDYEKMDDFLKEIGSTFELFNVAGTRLQIEKKNFTEENVKEAILTFIAQRVLNAEVLDTYKSEEDPLKLKIANASQGTQRLIIVSVIQELGKIHISNEQKKIFILFEEPEIYLHPQLKKNLYNALYQLSLKADIKVIISTHDPYFIELGKGQKIYRVYRNSKKEYSTDVEEINDDTGVLGYRSDAEINYIIFDIVSTDYLLQLYQKAYEEKREKFDTDKEIEGVKLSDIRNKIAHPTERPERNTNEGRPEITESMKRGATDYLRNILLI